MAPASTLAATGNQTDCTVHGPIRILEDHGEFGFTWDDPVTGEEAYRPGSGVVAGEGTEANPYVIEGWCISGADWDPPNIELKSCGFDFGDATPDPESTGVIICGTTDHFVFRNSTVELWEHGTGIGNVTPDTGTIEHTSHENNTYQMYVDRAPGFHIRHNLAHGVDLTEMFRTAEVAIHGHADRARIEHNTLVGAGTLVGLEGEDLRIADNRLDSSSTFHLDVRGTSLEVANNTLEYTVFDEPPLYGIYLRGDDARVAGNAIEGYQSAGLTTTGGAGIEISHNHASTTYGATGFSIGGEDVLVHNVTVEGGWKGVSTSGSAVDARIENATVTGADRGLAAYKRENTTFTHNEVTGYTDAGVHVEQAENTTLRQTNLEDTNGTGLEVVDTDTTVDARHNWWGCPDGPDDPRCDDVVGDAVYEPWLTEENKKAGAEG